MHRTYFRTAFTFVTYVEELWCPYGSCAQDYKAMGKRYSTGSVITLRTRDARVSPVVPFLPPSLSFFLFLSMCMWTCAYTSIHIRVHTCSRVECVLHSFHRFTRLPLSRSWFCDVFVLFQGMLVFSGYLLNLQNPSIIVLLPRYRGMRLFSVPFAN